MIDQACPTDPRPLYATIRYCEAVFAEFCTPAPVAEIRVDFDRNPTPSWWLWSSQVALKFIVTENAIAVAVHEVRDGKLLEHSGHPYVTTYCSWPYLEWGDPQMFYERLRGSISKVVDNFHE